MRKRQLLQIFQKFDLDNTGFISSSELRLIGDARNEINPLVRQNSGEWTEARNDRLVAMMDGDKDGKMSPTEFVQYFDFALSLDPEEFDKTIAEFIAVADTCQSNKKLVRRISSNSTTKGDPNEIQDKPAYTEAGALELFLEPIDFSLEAAVPDPVPFDQRLRNMLERHDNFILTQEEHEIGHGVLEEVGRFQMLEASSTSLETEQEREQEQEQQKEVQARRDQQIEIEKFVDREYSRNHESPTPWSIQMLAKTVEQSEQVQGDHPFYPLRQFRLRHCEPLAFPSTMFVSRNYFNPSWSGLRRIKNVVVVMEWTADSEQMLLEELRNEGEPLSSAQHSALEEAHALLSASVGSNSLNRMALANAIQAVTDMEPSDDLLDTVITRFADGGQQGFPHLSIQAFRRLLQSSWLHHQHPGRNWVALSLAEAETLRRVIHLRHNRPFIPGTNVELALRFAPSAMPTVMSASLNRGGTILDTTAGWRTGTVANTGCTAFEANFAHAAWRFFDGEMFFPSYATNLIIRALRDALPSDRESFFLSTIASRRRLERKWQVTDLLSMIIIRGSLMCTL